MNKAYAFRTWSSPFHGNDTSSAEWPEDLALELGDRVSDHLFLEMMYYAWALEFWVGQK